MRSFASLRMTAGPSFRDGLTRLADQTSLLLDIPEHRRPRRDESRDVLARRRNQTPFAEMDIGRPLRRPDLRRLGDLLQLGPVGRAGEAIAQLFHLRAA